MYSLNCSVTLYQVCKISSSISSQFGNKKGVNIQLLYQDTLLNIKGLHCKEPKDEITYESFVNNGLLQLNLSRPKGFFNNIYYCICDYYYDIKDKKAINIIMGDFNPKDNTKTNLIKHMINTQSVSYTHLTLPTNREV